MKFKEMNLPNKLTTIRMFCVPFMLVLFVLFSLWCMLKVGKMADEIVFFTQNNSEK